jgi:hypothetical protein
MRERLKIERRERRESRAAVLRRNEQTRFSSASDDEVGGFHARCANAPAGVGQKIGERSSRRFDDLLPVPHPLVPCRSRLPD